MLWHKAWRETRGRFITAVIVLTVMTGSNVYEYLATQKLLPQPQRDDRNTGGGSNRAGPRDSRGDRDPEGFSRLLWYRVFRDNLTQMGVFFAILLGCGGLLHESSKGSALFTLSMPVTRKQLLGARTGTGLAQLLRDLDHPSARDLDPGADRSASDSASSTRSRTALCIFFVAAVFYSLAAFLSTLFADIWRPLLIAIGIACALAFASFVAPQLNIFSVMNGESYFRTGSLPWMGFVTSAVIATALLYSAAETLERRDF